MAGDPNPITAEVLNAAMESLGLPDLRFEAVEGKPVLRRDSADISLEQFIGLMLTGVGAAHLQRIDVAERLAKLERDVTALSRSEGALQAATEDQYRGIADAIADIRRRLALPALLEYKGAIVAPKLTIEPIDPDL